MLIVLCFAGLRVVIYPADHRPARLHVIGADGEAVFVLSCPTGPRELRESYGFSRAQVGWLKDELAGRIAVLREEWSRIHGSY